MREEGWGKIRLTDRPEGHFIGCECDGCYHSGYGWSLLYSMVERDPAVAEMKARHSIEHEALVESLLPAYIETRCIDKRVAEIKSGDK